MATMEPCPETKPLSLGSSILVPSVQELVKEPFSKVPPRYERPDQEPAIVSRIISVSEVPVIDLQSLIAGGPIGSELERLHSACKDWGFFQLINHGVSSSLLEKIKLEIQQLFNLPMEEKKKLWQLPGEVEGFGQAFVVSDEQKLDWGDMFFISTRPVHLRKPHLIPNLPPALREAVEAYSSEMKNLAMTILCQMARALKMETEVMRELFEEGVQSMRMNYYPPCPQPNKVIGLSPHSDAAGLTILLQVNEESGLQIRKDGIWIPVTPMPNAFVVNIGDILEIVTNGIYRSIEHRATVNSAKERLSIATFFNPRLDGEVGPARSLITPETPALFRKISMEEYMKGLFSRKLDGKSYVDVMKIQNGKDKDD